jgi:murein DD-endopeptidase MepM/ murein hydrolase activator NlpD
MIFHRPVKPWVVGQKFAQNSACVDTATNSKVISCDGLNPPPGYKSLYGSQGHKGIDVRAYRGQPVYAIADGVVDEIDTNPRTGLDVRIVSEINGKRYRHIYEHLLGYQHHVGSKVLAGELIGWADNTGYSAGDHLHLQVEEWRGKWVPIDPEPLLSNLFAPDALFIANKAQWVKERLAILSEEVTEFLRKR